MNGVIILDRIQNLSDRVSPTGFVEIESFGNGVLEMG